MPPYGGEADEPGGGPPRRTGRRIVAEFNLRDPVGSFMTASLDVLLNPVGFFRGIARRGNFVNPLVYAVVCGLIYAFLGGLVTLLIFWLFADPETNEALSGGAVGFFVDLILSPVFTVIGLFAGAGITHLLVMLFVKPTNAGFEATFRVASYVSAILLVAWIPIVYIIAAIYGIVLAIFGIREVHETTTGKAAAIVLIPLALVIFLTFLFGVLLGALLLGAAQQI